MSTIIERRGRVQIITLDRETKRNALNPEIAAGLEAGLNELEDDPELWVGVLTGGTSCFSAGADLSTGGPGETPRGGTAGLIHRRRTKPLIAAVEGFALGGGMELVLCCDLVVAATNASFGLPEVKRGLMPDFGGAFRSARMLPANVARELVLTGDSISAERAERLGFVNVLTEPGGALTGAMELAGRIVTNAPIAIREAMALVNDAVSGDEAPLWERSNAAHARLLQTEDVREGVGAFLEKRSPVWRGR